MLKSRRYLEEHERRMILADFEAIGGRGTWFDMERHVPGRYDPRYFNTACERLFPDVKYRGRTHLFGFKMWALRDHEGDPAHKDKEGLKLPDLNNPDTHLNMMKVPDNWPLGHVLPLARNIPDDMAMPEHDILCFDTIRGGQRREFGVMAISASVPRWTVFRLNVHDARLRALFIAGRVDDSVTTYHGYSSAEEVYADGWRVQ